MYINPKIQNSAVFKSRRRRMVVVLDKNISRTKSHIQTPLFKYYKYNSEFTHRKNTQVHNTNTLYRETTITSGL
ncbi:MAG: hypothetical protein KAT05_14330, partial [Spirochaetes bacterium]|nr:hypothetical protein [Spirochaetota bacterium]